MNTKSLAQEHEHQGWFAPEKINEKRACIVNQVTERQSAMAVKRKYEPDQPNNEIPSASPLAGVISYSSCLNECCFW